jgi:hypothetical protein
MIQDKNLSRKRHRDYIPSEVWGVTATAVKAAVGSLRAINLPATSDAAVYALPLPRHWDYTEDIFLRYFMHNAAGGTVVLTPTFEPAAFDATQPAIAEGLVQLADGTTATITIVLGAATIDPTVWMKLAKNTLNEETAANQFLWFQLLLTTDAANIDPNFLGMEVDYVPTYTTGDLMKLADDPTDA